MANLVGDVRMTDITPEKAKAFYEALAALMEKYQVNKVDVAWERFGSPREIALSTSN